MIAAIIIFFKLKLISKIYLKIIENAKSRNLMKKKNDYEQRIRCNGFSSF